MATRGSFDTSSVGNFYFSFEWERTGYNSSANEHYIHYKVTAHNSSGSYRTVYLRHLEINGSEIYDETSSERYYDGDVVTEGNITIDSYNSEGDGRIEASFEAGVGTSSGSNCNGDDYWNIDRIPRYARITAYGRQVTINSVFIEWVTDANVDTFQYRLNGGGWVNAETNIDKSAGGFTIPNLQPNTYYHIEFDAKRKDSGLWSTDGGVGDYVNRTTYDYGKINSIPGFNLGDSERIGYSNPSGSSMRIAIYNTAGSVPYCGYRQCNGTAYTFQFTDEELDNFYKLFGNSNTITVRVYLLTTCNGINYYNYENVTITLTGNQKTVKTKVGNVYKRGKIKTNVNGVWKNAVVWTNVNGTWKRSI